LVYLNRQGQKLAAFKMSPSHCDIREYRAKKSS
jgi:hypothetical protein